MTQGFVLRCVATGSACKMIWTATQRRDFFYFYVASPSKSFYMHFRSRRNAAQILALYYKPALFLRCVAVQIILYALPVATQILASYYKPVFMNNNKVIAFFNTHKIN